MLARVIGDGAVLRATAGADGAVVARLPASTLVEVAPSVVRGVARGPIRHGDRSLSRRAFRGLP